jgi:hypothetical protein
VGGAVGTRAVHAGHIEEERIPRRHWHRYRLLWRRWVGYRVMDVRGGRGGHRQRVVYDPRRLGAGCKHHRPVLLVDPV